MTLVDRAKNILLTPKTEWPRIAEESATPQSILVGYVMILAAIGPIAMLIAGTVFAATVAIVSYVVALGITFLLAWIVDALAPTFGAEKNFVQSLKLVAYSCTAVWLAGIFQLVPVLGGIIGLLATIYTFYTVYLGLPVMKKCPADKAVVFAVAIAICGFLVSFVLSAVLMSVATGGDGPMRMMGIGRL